jgi:competence protein ComEC
LGIQRYDWALLLDPVAAEGPSCWQALTPTLVEGLQLGQRLTSPGLQVEPLAEDSQALVLQAGRLQWGLLPDRQAWWSWQRQPRRGVDGLWLGFTPGRHERQALPALPANRLWLPAAGSPSGWRQA